MKNRMLFFVLSIAVLLSVPFVSPASGDGHTIDAGKAEYANAASVGRALSQNTKPSTSRTDDIAGAAVARWRPRLMTIYRASSEARSSARRIYLSPQFTFDDYGVGRCYRMNRSKVRCYTWVSEDYFDEYGSYDDTLLCDWWTTSRYTSSGRLVVSTQQTDCVWLSEV